MTGAERFFLLGAFGWCVEIVFTSVMDSLVLGSAENPWKLEGKSYLWMHPIYGGGLYLGTVILPLVRPKMPLVLRLLVGVLLCFGIEYVSGWLLRVTTGVCPWDYSQAEWNVHGLIRLDYAPAWALLSYLVEWLTDILDNIRVLSTVHLRSEQQKRED